MTFVRDPHTIDLHETTMAVRRWHDPLIDASGHDVHGRYVELFWLGVIGPSATWLLRRLVTGLAEFPDGYLVDLPETAQALGLAFHQGRHSPFTRALQRLLFFGMAHQSSDGLGIRCVVPPLTRRQVERLPPHLRDAHPFWMRSSQDVEAAEYARAHWVADALRRSGDDSDTIERRLHLLGIDPIVSAVVLRSDRPLAPVGAPSEPTGVGEPTSAAATATAEPAA